jgi:hypothetical protein
MCKRISFIYKAPAQVALFDLESHSATQAFHEDKTEDLGWYEGHYLPDESIECRTPTGRDRKAEANFRYEWPTYAEFEKYCLGQLGQSGAGTASGKGGQ